MFYPTNDEKLLINAFRLDIWFLAESFLVERNRFSKFTLKWVPDFFLKDFYDQLHVKTTWNHLDVKICEGTTIKFCDELIMLKEQLWVCDIYMSVIYVNKDFLWKTIKDAVTTFYCWWILSGNHPDQEVYTGNGLLRFELDCLIQIHVFADMDRLNFRIIDLQFQCEHQTQCYYFSHSIRW